MAQIDVLVPLRDIPVNSDELLSIQRNDLVPLLNDQYRLNHYADSVIQAQSVLLKWSRSTVHFTVESNY